MISWSESISANILPRPNVCCGPVSSNLRKIAATECFERNDHEKGIYHLTESHAVGFRSSILADVKLAKESQVKYFNLPHVSFSPEIISFDSEYAVHHDKGLFKRLQELPEEWTLVQLTQAFSPLTRCTPRKAETPVNNFVIHITKLTCGSSARKPFSVTLPEAEGIRDGLKSVFDVICKSAESITILKNSTPSRLLREKCVLSDTPLKKYQVVTKASREESSQAFKSFVDELNADWLRHWRCMFLGRLCAKNITSELEKAVNNVLKKCKCKLDDSKISLLYQIADGSGHLEDDEIRTAVLECIEDESVSNQMIEAIKKFKNSNSTLVVQKRYPVLLILDEFLDRIPWEMLPVLKRHPVSRVFSVHFAHAMYEKFKNSIVDGCCVINKAKGGYYVINPDKDLEKMEKKICDFLSSRISNWKGVAGQPPSIEEFSNALQKYSILLYCGHGNGTHYLSSEAVFSSEVNAVPLLFGCNSVKMNDLGGRVSLTGIAMKYLTAGSPCVLGMLWKVTSNDADNMSLSLLNNWLPGKPIQIEKFIKGDLDITIKSEPELLRNLRFARESCMYYTNAAALVVYGIPVKFS